MQRLLLALALLAPSVAPLGYKTPDPDLDCGFTAPGGIVPTEEGNGLKFFCGGEEENSPCQDGKDRDDPKELTTECPLTLDCGVDQGCRGLQVKAQGSITADCTGQQGVCNGATFSAPTVTIDCSGNNSCKNIKFDEEVVKLITLTCGPFVGPGGNIKDNNVCGGIEIPFGQGDVLCKCESFPAVTPGGNTDCPNDCEEELK